MTHPSLLNIYDTLDALVMQLTLGYNRMPKNPRVRDLVDDALIHIQAARPHVVQERAEILAALGISGATVKTAYDQGYRLEAIYQK